MTASLSICNSVSILASELDLGQVDFLNFLFGENKEAYDGK